MMNSIFVTTFILLLSFTVQAFQPSAKQLEQFQQLSPEQQERLARQYGVDLNDPSLLDGMQKEGQFNFGETEQEHGNLRAKQTFREKTSLSEMTSPLGFEEEPEKLPYSCGKPKAKKKRSKYQQLLAESNKYKHLNFGKSKGELRDKFGRVLMDEEEAFDMALEEERLKQEAEELGEVEEDVLPVFGHDLFDNAFDSFMPAVDVPTPADYVMGPGDNVVVQLYGKENTQHQFTVTREGVIHFPKLGPVSVIGLNFTDLKQLITTTVEKQMIGVKASVTLGALRSIRIFILGDAKYPGSFTVNSLSTMTNALMASGGIKESGSLRKIQLKRAGKLIATLDLYDLLLKGDTSKDQRLQPGDVIFIPPTGKVVGICGEVKRPAVYELRREKNAADVVKLAGGFLPTAFAEETRVQRISKKG